MISALICVLALSLASAGITIWVIREVGREQQIIGRVLQMIPPDRATELSELPGELQWQYWLSLLVLLNGVAMIVTLVLLARAWLSSASSLRDVRLIAADILASMDQAVLTTNSQGVITSINPQSHRMYGLTGDYDYIGRPIEDFPDCDGQLAGMCREVLSCQKAIHDRDVPLPRSGGTLHYRADCCPIRSVSQPFGTVIYVRDVTERVLIEERMRRMERYMGLGSLAAGLHHEIKNPLGALSLHVQLLDERLDEPDRPSDVAEMLGVLKTEVTRINGVLESFRSFAASSRLRCEQTQPGTLVDKVVQLVRPQADLQGITLVVDCDRNLPSLMLDPVRMDQVLLNLVVNAFEAMPDGGTLTIRAFREPRHAVITVADTGGGIPESIRSSVFDPYFTTKSEGTGMGLPLCEKIIRQHDGLIGFQTSSHGTEFCIRLPLEETARESAQPTTGSSSDAV